MAPKAMTSACPEAMAALPDSRVATGREQSGLAPDQGSEALAAQVELWIDVAVSRDARLDDVDVDEIEVVQAFHEVGVSCAGRRHKRCSAKCARRRGRHVDLGLPPLYPVCT